MIRVTQEDRELWARLPGNKAQWFRGALRERMSQIERQYRKVASDPQELVDGPGGPSPRHGLESAENPVLGPQGCKGVPHVPL